MAGLSNDKRKTGTTAAKRLIAGGKDKAVEQVERPRKALKVMIPVDLADDLDAAVLHARTSVPTLTKQAWITDVLARAVDDARDNAGGNLPDAPPNRGGRPIGS